MVPAAYDFRCLSAADLPTLEGWLWSSHVQQWWDDPQDQLALIREDIDDPAMDQFIVSLADRRFGYLQCYDPGAWPDHGFGEHAAGTRGIDQFVGEADMLERGHGTAFIRAFTDGLLQAGTPRIVTDPRPENTRAARIYEKAGCRLDRPVNTSDGQALLMVRDT